MSRWAGRPMPLGMCLEHAYHPLCVQIIVARVTRAIHFRVRFAAQGLLHRVAQFLGGATGMFHCGNRWAPAGDDCRVRATAGLPEFTVLEDRTTDVDVHVLIQDAAPRATRLHYIMFLDPRCQDGPAAPCHLVCA